MVVFVDYWIIIHYHNMRCFISLLDMKHVVLEHTTPFGAF